jgi:uncharacterized membrane protein
MASQSLILLRRNFRLTALLCLALIGLVAAGIGVPILFAVLRVLLGLVFVLFLPGFTLQAALFSRQGDLDLPERLGLSFGLSLAVIPWVALLLDKLPWGIKFWPILVAEGSLILFFSLLAIYRLHRLPPNERIQPVNWTGLPEWLSSLEKRERRLYAILTGTMLIALLSAAAILYLPTPADLYTEFYILGAQGLAEEYIRETRLGEELTVTVGIVNHERKTKTYQIEVNIQNLWGEGGNLLVGVAGPFTLQPGETVERPVHWQMPWPGQDQQVEFHLLMDDNPTPYRTLFLLMNVIEQ